MADFIESFDPQELPPPFRFPGVSMTTFAIDLGLEHGLPGLNTWCDTYLNIDPNARYRPLTPVGYLCILDYPRLYCDAPGYGDWGYVPQKEVFFTFPAVRLGRALGNIFLPTELSWAMPFIAVNNATSAITGRTVLGFQKIFGTIDLPVKPDKSFEATVSLPVFKTTGHDVEQQYEPVVSVWTGPPNPAIQALDGTFPWNLLGHSQSMDYIENTSMHLLEDLVPGLLEVINLKQMRGGQYPKTAVYQALVQSRMSFANMTAPVFYENPSFMFHADASMTCGINGAELALIGGKKLPAIAAFSMTLDMTLDHVVDAYVTPQSPAPEPDGLCGTWHGFWGPYVKDLQRLLFPFA